MGVGFNNNLLANTNRHFNVNVSNKSKSMEKLSSGYRINRAADDAAGLQISEKMRSQIRGLERGATNAQDGISWVQTGDGALNEVHALLHRMRELTVQSLNDTNTPADRAKCQAEFDQLQSEIDKITKTTEFNTKKIFCEHESTYYQFEGNAKWDQSQPHVISSGSNEMIIEYRKTEADAVQTAVITIPEGVYTTQELIDEFDDEIIAQGLDSEGFALEFTEDGTCNLNYEGGEIIDNISGGLSYLLYETYEGSSMGALIGTTIFSNEYVTLGISSENNNMSFDIENFDGTKNSVSITIPNGQYTRSQLIEELNNRLAGTDVEATAYGTGIKLEGTDSIVTGFKGNMFKIDDKGSVYHSVFYDNVKYGNINMTTASFTGGQVKPSAAEQEEFHNYIIDSSNNVLTFSPNGATTPIDFIIPHGSHSVDDMVSMLNTFFTDNNLELSASIYPNSSSAYQGIKIDSAVKGNHSEVGIDKNSSAYNTLFVVREYNSYSYVSPQNVTVADVNAKVTGAKQFTGNNLPLTLTSGVNDTFTLTIDGNSYDITLDAATNGTTYNSADDIKNNINSKLSAVLNNTPYKDQVQASVSSGKIILTATDDSSIKNLTVSATGNNNGYKDIFVKSTINYNTTISDTEYSIPPSVTLPNAVTDPATFDSSNNTLDITFNGADHTVTFPTGPLSHQQIIDEIENQIPEMHGTVNNTFTDINKKGTTDTSSVAISDTGETRTSSGSYNDTGKAETQEGFVGVYFNNTPAKVTITPVVPDRMAITNENNKLQLTIDIDGNGNTKLIELTPNKTYSKTELVTELQKKINEAFGTGFGGAKVSIDGSGKLNITADLMGAGNVMKPGSSTRIACSTSTSTFLKALHTTETAASDSSNRILQNTINITEDSNTFSFKYKDNGVEKNVSLVLDKGTYSRSSIINELNKQLTNGNHAVTASLEGNYLKLTTNDVGNDTSITYNSSTGGTSVEALFGALTTETAASGVADRAIQNEITIEDDSRDFVITINGDRKELTLEKSTYNRDEFVDMLNKVFTDADAGVTAELDTSNRITYTTIEKGNDSSILLKYSDSPAAMKQIYGESAVVSPGIDASFTPDGKLVLTGTRNGGTISVEPQNGNVFYPLVGTEILTEPTYTQGSKSQSHSKIDGANITEPITINLYNNELKFDYYMNGTKKSVSITVPDGDYDFNSGGSNPGIADYLQQELDTQVGAGQLTVSASTTGIVIEAVNAGSKYYLNNFSGDFYNKVISSYTYRKSNYSPVISNGTQTNDLAYTVGRKDIRHNPTTIKTGINDTLKLDFTYGGKTEKIEVTLDAGTYSGSSLVSELQKKLNEQLVNKGLEPGTIEVSVGGVNTGVSGSNDNNALIFKLSSTVRLPSDGQYIIDGVSGNAAFSIFYQTDGELVPAYIKGAKDISDGVTIKPGETELSFKVDGTQHSIQIPEGDYTAQEIIDEINSKLTDSNIPVVAEMEDNLLKLSFNKMGKHRVSDISGLAKNELFFVENGDKEVYQDMKIQVGANSGQLLSIERKPVNTAFLKINSIVITQPKYANKALIRLDDAIEEVSSVRSSFGSSHNRLLHALDNNNNAEENLQSAESVIRDTNMAKEIMNHAKSSILEQAATAMQAQLQNMGRDILKLLE